MTKYLETDIIIKTKNRQIVICENVMKEEFDIHYGEEEIKIVKSGIKSIKAVLTGKDNCAKERLLFYLDWYMDPYYKNDLSVIGEALKELLQRIVINDNEIGIVEEALHLLEAYTDSPYVTLENNIDKVPEEFKPIVFFLFNKDNR